MTHRQLYDLTIKNVIPNTVPLKRAACVILAALTTSASVRAATVEVTPDRITIANDWIARTFSIQGGVCRTVRFDDLTAKTHLDVSGQGIHLRLLSGKEVDGSTLRISGKVTTTPPNGKGPRVAVTIPVACTQPAAVAAQIHLQAVDGEHFMHKWCDVESAEPVDTVQVEQLDGTFKTDLGGRGQPVFIDGRWFAGLEYPAGYHTGSAGKLRLYHFPGRKQFTTKRAVWGLDVEGDVANSFEAYLSRVRLRPRSFLQYNSWYDLRGTELAAETLIQRFEEFRKAFLSPYGLRFDAFVPDDGWQNPQSIWDVNRKILPQGYKPLADALAKADSRVGLWMPLNGTKLDVAWGVKQGYEKSDQGDYYCLASSRYGPAIRKAVEVRIRDANLSYCKHDFNWFRCSGKGHRHVPTPRHGFEANVDAFLDLLAYERKLQPDIFLNVTSGVWLSPWWLMYADTVWMGADDFGYEKHYPQLAPREWAMSYRDQHLYRKYRVERVQCPGSALMTHGIIHGRRNRLGGPDETLREWSDYVVMYYARGVMLKELYLTPSLLNAEWWDVLGRATRWAIHNAPTMVHTRMVGGEPRSGAVYGYVHWSQRKGILVLRNPAPAAQSFELTLGERPRRMGSPDAAWDVEVVYPYLELLEARLSGRRSVKLTVPGCSAMVWEMHPASMQGGRPRGVRRLDAGRTCRAADVTASVKVAPGSIGPASRPATTTQAASKPSGAAGPCLALGFTLAAQRLPRADVLVISRGANILPIGAPTLNGKPVAVQKVEGVGWQMLRVDASGLTGDVAITAQLPRVSVPFVFSPPTVEAWLLTELPLRVVAPATQPVSRPATAPSPPPSPPTVSQPAPAAPTTSSKPASAPAPKPAPRPAPASQPPPPTTTTRPQPASRATTTTSKPTTTRSAAAAVGSGTLETSVVLAATVLAAGNAASQPAAKPTTTASQPDAKPPATAPSPPPKAPATRPAGAATRPSPKPTTVPAPASAPSPDRPLPRAYRPEVVRRSYCLLKPTPLGAVPSAAIKPEELAKIKAAKLRVELYDVNGGAYAEKSILLNGQPLCQIPPNKGAASKWETRIIDLPGEWLPRIKMDNTVQLTNKPHDLFKFRGIALAVQTADGRWVTSSLAEKVHASSRNWRYAEGEIFEGELSPKIQIGFQAAK